MIGLVVSTKLKNTVTVLVSKVAKHPLYKKNYMQSKKYLVEAKMAVKQGDIVEFASCRPISKRITSTVTKVIGKSITEIADAELKKHAEGVIAEVMPEVEKGEGESEKGKEAKIADAKKIKSNSETNRKEDKREEKGK